MPTEGCKMMKKIATNKKALGRQIAKEKKGNADP